MTTYAQLKQRVDALAAFLQQRLGVAPGDRVLLASQNCPQFVAAFYAILRAGAVVVPVNPMSKAAGDPLLRARQRRTGGIRGAGPAGERAEPACSMRIVVHAYRDALASGLRRRTKFRRG